MSILQAVQGLVPFMAGNSRNPAADILFVLNAHLPFVRHPEYEKFLEENWFFEALSETYLPLLRVFRRLEMESIPFRLTISISPTLMSMFEDELLQHRYLAHLECLLELADKEMYRLQWQPQVLRIAQMYNELYRANLRDFVELYKYKVLQGFNYFRQRGNLEIITTMATHAFLPTYQNLGHVINAQIMQGLETYNRMFHGLPRGMWLPECGYFPGLEEYLKNFNVEYFFSAAHALVPQVSKSELNGYSPVMTPNFTTLFPRNREASNCICSSEYGLPGHSDYRDFYRDIGFELPRDYIAPYGIDADVRVNTGFKYYAISGIDAQKNFYCPDKGHQRACTDARNYLIDRLKQAREIAPFMETRPLIVAAFDAELFGHWWFEGLDFLEAIFRELHDFNGEVLPAIPTDYIGKRKYSGITVPAFSSWGDKGYSQVWLDGSNKWIYRHTYKMSERMLQLLQIYPDEKGLKARALNQAARELFLAQSSDWPLIIKAGTTVGYAEQRIRSHVNNFNKIYEGLMHKFVDTEWLTALEKRNNIFPSIDYTIFNMRNKTQLSRDF